VEPAYEGFLRKSLHVFAIHERALSAVVDDGDYHRAHLFLTSHRGKRPSTATASPASKRMTGLTQQIACFIPSYRILALVSNLASHYSFSYRSESGTSEPRLSLKLYRHIVWIGFHARGRTTVYV